MVLNIDYVLSLNCPKDTPHLKYLNKLKLTRSLLLGEHRYQRKFNYLIYHKEIVKINDFV